MQFILDKVVTEKKFSRSPKNRAGKYVKQVIHFELSYLELLIFLGLRLSFIKRKGTKAARKIPKHFPSIKLQFLEKIKGIASTHKIPHKLILNLDQTRIKFVPSGNWTMAEEGSKQVLTATLRTASPISSQDGSKKKLP